MQLFTATSAVAPSATSFHSHSYAATANRASKRTAWYPAFGEMATWSPIG